MSVNNWGVQMFNSPNPSIQGITLYDPSVMRRPETFTDNREAKIPIPLLILVY